MHAVRDRAMLPGPLATWVSGWIGVLASAVGAEDIAHWPHTVALLVKWVAFLGSLGGVSFVEMLILYQLWAGERLTF